MVEKRYPDGALKGGVSYNPDQAAFGIYGSRRGPQQADKMLSVTKQIELQQDEANGKERKSAESCLAPLEAPQEFSVAVTT
jgi:hypothetical protein